LIRKGHRVTVLTTDAFDEHNRIPTGIAPRHLDGIAVHTLANLSNRLAYHHQGFLPWHLPGALTKISQDPPDVIHLHGHRHLLNNGARSLARRLNCPYILTPNGTLLAIERKQAIKKVFDLLLGHPVVKDADTLIAVSRAEIAQFRQAGVSGSRVTLIPNGLDLSEFAPPLPHRTQFRRQHHIQGPMVLYMGKLTPRKGVDHLIRAMTHLTDISPTLVIAGNDMGTESRLIAIVRDLHLQEQVRFVGLLTGEARLAALASADVLAYPSTLEIFGLVPFEGLMAGAPVVVGDDCGCGELVQEARAGLLTPFGDVPALAMALRRLLTDGRVRQEMVARGRRYIREQLDWDRVVTMTLEVYRNVLNRTH